MLTNGKNTATVSRALVLEALAGLDATPPTGPEDIEVWLDSCAFWLAQLRDLHLVIGAHSCLIQTLKSLPWTHDYLASKAISDRLAKGEEGESQQGGDHERNSDRDRAEL